MTAIYKVLKRKDAASVIVAVVVALIISQLLPSLTSELTGWIAGTNREELFFADQAPNWRDQYLTPVVSAGLQLLALEVLIRLYGLGRFLVAGNK